GGGCAASNAALISASVGTRIPPRELKNQAVPTVYSPGGRPKTRYTPRSSVMKLDATVFALSNVRSPASDVRPSYAITGTPGMGGRGSSTTVPVMPPPRESVSVTSERCWPSASRTPEPLRFGLEAPYDIRGYPDFEAVIAKRPFGRPGNANRPLSSVTVERLS